MDLITFLLNQNLILQDASVSLTSCKGSSNLKKKEGSLGHRILIWGQTVVSDVRNISRKLIVIN